MRTVVSTLFWGSQLDFWYKKQGHDSMISMAMECHLPLELSSFFTRWQISLFIEIRKSLVHFLLINSSGGKSSQLWMLGNNSSCVFPLGFSMHYMDFFFVTVANNSILPQEFFSSKTWVVYLFNAQNIHSAFRIISFWSNWI